jgi:hypothetical protein
MTTNEYQLDASNIVLFTEDFINEVRSAGYEVTSVEDHGFSFITPLSVCDVECDGYEPDEGLVYFIHYNAVDDNHSREIEKLLEKLLPCDLEELKCEEAA